MAKISLDEVLRYLKPFARFEGIQINQLPALEQFATIEQLRKDFVQRSKQLNRSERSTTKQSLDDRLESLGLLKTVLADPVVEEIRCILQVFEIEERERRLLDKNKSAHSVPTQFHRSLLCATFVYVQEVRRIAGKFEVSELRYAPYLDAAHRLMIREARALNSIYPFGKTVGEPATGSQSWHDMIIAVYSIILESLKAARAGRGCQELAIQLTRVICSPSEFFRPGNTPTSQSIKDQLRSRRKLKAKAAT